MKRSARIAVDIGGTFTDGLASVDGRIWVAKTLTTPRDPGEAVTTVMADLVKQMKVAQAPSPAERPRNVKTGEAPALRVSEVVHGTTLVTNTLIERKGANTGLVVTKGTRDVLDIGREWRYDLYDLNLELPRPLVATNARVEADERLDASGEVVTKLSDAELDRLVEEIRSLDVDAVAVCLLHSYVNDEHEKKIAQVLRERLPGVAVSVSSGLAREIREFERMSTTVGNAYVQPLMADYLRKLDDRVNAISKGAPLRIMVSSGGFTSGEAAAETPILLLESGPAGGVLSALNTARANGIGQILAFDMGGTTAKACVAVGGEPLIAHSFEAARVHRFKRGSGLPMLIPSIDLIEIGAGGGSIAHVNELGLLNIGPESAGADPGPACYGQGGTDATVTDADLVLGYLNADNFLGGEMKLRRDLAEAALERIAKKLALTTTDVAWGICNIVNENMAAAARIHIAEKGHDPREFTMVATGGAGPVHVVEVARKLQIPRVLATIAAGAGSCLGLLAAPARVDRSWSNPTLVKEIDWSRIAKVYADLRADAERELASAGAGDAKITWWIGADMRYAGQGHNVSVSVPWQKIAKSTEAPLLKEFEKRYRQLYGHLVPNALPQVITWRLTGRSVVKSHRFMWGDERVSAKPVLRGRREIFLPLKKRYGKVPVYDRYSLAPGAKLPGPVILEERESTLVVPVAADVTILPDYTVSVRIKEF
ncbi:MAG TPA: hydantoinase/oxoprolinase family protein [Burkholderiales bacterium]|nr:hydantoinase/oxoprolinase family protein [Burkholderiales bacterium]